MVRSMTGYGRARQTLNGRDITVEVRSVNNRYLDCTVKMPRTYVFAEDAIKSRVQKSISRGKTDVFITIESAGAEQTVPAQATVMIFGFSPGRAQLTITAGTGYSMLPPRQLCFPIFFSS